MDEQNAAEGQPQMENPAPATPIAPEHDAEQKKLLVGILSYLSILVIVAYFLGKNDPSTHFHIKQGAVLFVLEVATWVVLSMIPLLFPLVSLVHIGLVILAVIGLINVFRHREKELPFIGDLAKHVPF
jgi:uncharacterized membrane protein